VSPDDEITGPLTLVVGLLLVIIPVVILALLWGARMRRELRVAGREPCEDVDGTVPLNGGGRPVGR